MVTTPEQFLQIQKAALEVFQSATITSIEGFEKLTALNVQAAKASIDESTDALKSMTDVKDAKQLAEMPSSTVQPATDKVTAYYKHVYEIANETGAELAKLFEKQVAEGNRQLYAAIDAMVDKLDRQLLKHKGRAGARPHAALKHQADSQPE